jgi:DNA-binding response OmpR family regulator
MSNSPPIIRGDDYLAVGDLRLLHRRYELQWGPQVVHLKPQECALLVCLLATPDETVPTTALQRALWADGPYPSSNGLQVITTRVRHKLARLQYPGGVTRIRAQGYRFDPARGVPPSPSPMSGSRHQSPSAVLEVEANQVNGERRYAMRAGQRSIPLTPLEAALLTCLRREPGHVVEHTRLRVAGWGEHPVPLNRLHVYVMRLRQQLAQAGSPWRIRTYPHCGYLLEPPSA